MIILNDDKARQKNYQRYRMIKYKGQMSNTLLVIEDVLDKSKKNPDCHKCICKCLRCGKIYPIPITIRRIREKTAKCSCGGTDTRYRFRDKKGKMLKF